MRLRISHFGLSVLCVISVISPQLGYAQTIGDTTSLTFSDVPLTHPNHTAITTLKERGIISGYEDGSYKPERTVTRAEIVKIVLLALHATRPEIPLPDSNTAPAAAPFSDVPADAWYAPYVATASSLSIVGGYPDGTFQPDRTVTRVEAIKIILNSVGIVVSPATQQLFDDVPTTEWYAPYVQYVAQHRLLEVPGAYFGKDEGMRRKDVAQILYAMEEEVRAMQLPTVPVTIVSLLFLLWVGPGIWNWYRARKAGAVASVKLGIFSFVFGPLATLVQYVRALKRPSFSPLRHRTTAFIDTVATQSLQFTKRRYTYFRRPRHLAHEVLLWIDSNRGPIFGICCTVTLLYFVFVIGETSLNTYRYKASFAVQSTETISSTQ